MSIDYLDIQKFVARMIKERGKRMLLRKIGKDVDDNGYPTDIIIEEQEVDAVQASFEHRFVNGETIAVYDVRFYMSSLDLKPELENMSPLADMRLVDKKTEKAWRFKNVLNMSPSDINILFDIHAH